MQCYASLFSFKHTDIAGHIVETIGNNLHYQQAQKKCKHKICLHLTNKIFTCCSSHGFAQGGVYDVYFPLYSKVFLCAPDEQKYLITISMFCLCIFMFIILLLLCHIKQNKMDNSHATNKRKQIFYIHTQSINSFYLPVAPKNPVAWHSSMKTRALYLSAREQILLGKKNPGK